MSFNLIYRLFSVCFSFVRSLFVPGTFGGWVGIVLLYFICMGHCLWLGIVYFVLFSTWMDGNCCIIVCII